MLPICLISLQDLINTQLGPEQKEIGKFLIEALKLSGHSFPAATGDAGKGCLMSGGVSGNATEAVGEFA